jgi:hypothetical protein
MTEVTRILSAIEHDDPCAAEQLLPLVYDELRRLAAQKLAQEKPGQTLQATALVHEAYVRLVGSGVTAVCGEQRWDNRGHFFLLPRPRPCAASSSIVRGRSAPQGEVAAARVPPGGSPRVQP